MARSTFSRPFARCLLGACAVGGAYVVLAAALPDPSAAPVAAAAPAPGTTAPGSTPTPDFVPPGGPCAEHVEAPGHACGLDAKAMLARFQAATAERGAVHATYALAGDGRAVAGQVNLGLAPEAFAPGALEALAGRHGFAVARALPRLGLATLARAHATDRQVGLSVSDDVRAALPALAAEPGVLWAEPNVVARVALRPNDPLLPLDRGRLGAGLERAWDVTQGAPGVIVAVLDTGVDPAHPDLQGALLAGYDFVNQTPTLRDDNGHGTAMIGIIAARGDDGVGTAGVAYRTSVLPVKVADADGQASVADVAAGVDFALQRGARVINLSLGARVGAQALEAAVNRALAAGVVVVASSGNDPVHIEQLPAGYPGVVSATTLTPRGELAAECAIAESTDVGAPGEGVIAPLPGGVWAFLGGSSASAAFTSGVAALALAVDPTLTGPQVAQVLRQAQRPLPALAGLERVYRFGRLDAELAVLRARANLVDLAVVSLRVAPARPRPGVRARVWVEVENQGHAPAANVPLRVSRRDPQSGATIELGVVPVALALGERREFGFDLTLPAAGPHDLTAFLGPVANDVEPADNTRVLTVTADPTVRRDVRVLSRRVQNVDIGAGVLNLQVEVENVGTEPEQQVVLTGTATPLRSIAPPPGTALGPLLVHDLGRAVIPQLDAGQRVLVNLAWTLPPVPPTGIVRLDARVQQVLGETALDDNHAAFDLVLGRAGPLSSLYQQSNGVDVILDAPWRVEPGRPYLPVQVFVPSKGGRTPATRLRIERTELVVRDTPTGAGTTVYDDPRGAAPTVAAPGLELVDELGLRRAGGNALDLFGGVELDMNGRHDVLRLPRAALGVAASPGQPVVKYVDGRVRWEQRRVLFSLFTTTSSGSHRAVMRTVFAPTSLPALPGENHYHDVHHHTIAEWYFGSPIDIFAPRKAYGGPLQMVFESAYAMGFLAAPDAGAAWGRIITTDHSSFNNRTIPDPDGPDHRPPFGPQSPSQHPGLGQLEAYRRVLGPSVGQEIAFEQDVPIPTIPIPFVNNILDVLPGLPLGAHMLLYGTDHVEGPWHGGGWLRGPGNPNISVELFPLLRDAATRPQLSGTGTPFAYAAHPFGGQGWRDGNLDRGFGLDPALRDRDAVHGPSGKFVLKGVEFFNGRGTRSLPTAQIDFEDLNPWADPTFARGVATWDRGLWSGMTRWHRMLARTLDYAFTSDPETRFVRKVYQAGGSDAHGDFNFSTGRAATPLNVQATYNVGDEAYYGVRTYCFGDGKPGRTPEERWLEAYADGNSVTTDGPLLAFSLDADGRFDAANLRWHDAAVAAEDHDGRVGGEGPLDGGRTALVRRGAETPLFRYRYTSAPEHGPVASVLLYKSEAGNPNPTRRNGNVDQIVGVNRLALAGADQDLVQPLDPAREGAVTRITAFAAGAYTGGDPDQGDLGPDAFRCYTNPVFVVPYDVDLQVAQVDAATGSIPPGGLVARFAFDISMDPANYTVEVQGLDAQGASAGGAATPLALMVPASGSGWSDQPGIKTSRVELTNRDAIPLDGDAYPQAGRKTLVVYWRDAPRDAAGNALNPIAATVEAPWFAQSSVAPVGSTAAPATAGTPASAAPVTGGGKGSSGGLGCALARPVPGSGQGEVGAWALAAALLLFAGARRRVGRRQAA